MRKALFLIILLLSPVWESLLLARNDSIPEPVPETISLTILSGDHQYTRVGHPFETTVKVLASYSTGVTVANFPLHVWAVDPEYQEKQILITDSAGMATFIPAVMAEPGTFRFQISAADSPDTSVMIHLNVRKSNWVFLLIIGLFGGLGLFLLGMSMMSEGMQNSAGNRMRNILSKLTYNRFVALGLGAFVTMIIQSSSATNVMLVSFVNSKLMRFKQTIGVIMGAAIGTTITAQIIAFKITDYALLFVALGLAMQYMVKKQPVKEIGRAVLGFGILFFGMHIMSESMNPLRDYEPFLRVILTMQNPVLGILVGALFTALIQSSSAFIGILIILSMQGLLSLDAAIALLIGANVGTSITAVLASLNGSREAKQVALAHTLFKLVGAVIILFLINPFTGLITMLDPGVSDTAHANPRQIANAHTIYNFALCLLFIPFTTPFSKFISWIYPSREEPEEPFSLKYIDDALLKAPIVALDAARQELIRMMKKVYFMTEKIIHPFTDKDPKVFIPLARAEEEIDFLRDAISGYLLTISQNTLAADTAEEAFIMMNAVREYEQIADVISKQLLKKAKSWYEKNYSFSEEGKEELVRYHQHTLTILTEAVKVYENFDLKAARKLKIQYKTFREEYFEMEQHHYDRLKNNIEKTHASSKTHLEIITLLRVICSHATNTSRILLYKSDHKNIRKWPQ
ncbi:MAG: Na/Pi cotransporter family protein [Bacteroidales bacterium]|nr:Na/Pi cotransporter family protein [Bacteroidales bacterium]